MEGLEVKRLESVLKTADIFVTATGNKDIIMAHHIQESPFRILRIKLIDMNSLMAMVLSCWLPADC
jgi:5,10-methylene-tetrahydrofolate dehydrogenase/methenyl tetrahydrofolate cyclohydrolase